MPNIVLPALVLEQLLQLLMIRIIRMVSNSFLCLLVYQHKQPKVTKQQPQFYCASKQKLPGLGVQPREWCGCAQHRLGLVSSPWGDRVWHPNSWVVSFTLNPHCIRENVQSAAWRCDLMVLVLQVFTALAWQRKMPCSTYKRYRQS